MADQLDDGATLIPFSNALITGVNYHCLNWRDWWAANKERVPVKIALWAFDSVVRSRSEFGIEMLHENNPAIKKVSDLVWDTMTVLLGVRWCRLVKCSVAYELGQQDFHEKHKTRCACTMIHLLSLDDEARQQALIWSQHEAGAQAVNNMVQFSTLPLVSNGVRSIILAEDATKISIDVKKSIQSHHRRKTHADICSHIAAAEEGKHRGTKLRTYAMIISPATCNKPHWSLGIRSEIKRTIVTALRLGVLDLAIEEDRISGLDRRNQLYQTCLLCRSRGFLNTEDEIHFLFECESLESRRQTFLRKLKMLAPTIDVTNRQNLIYLMKSPNMAVHETLGDLAFALLKERSTLTGVCSKFLRS
jgi:hypothetical protein